MMNPRDRAPWMRQAGDKPTANGIGNSGEHNRDDAALPCERSGCDRFVRWRRRLFRQLPRGEHRRPSPSAGVAAVDHQIAAVDETGGAAREVERGTGAIVGQAGVGHRLELGNTRLQALEGPIREDVWAAIGGDHAERRAGAKCRSALGREVPGEADTVVMGVPGDSLERRCNSMTRSWRRWARSQRTLPG